MAAAEAGAEEVVADLEVAADLAVAGPGEEAAAAGLVRRPC